MCVKLGQKTQKCKQQNATKTKQEIEGTLDPYLQLLSERGTDKPKKFFQTFKMSKLKDNCSPWLILALSLPALKEHDILGKGSLDCKEIWVYTTVASFFPLKKTNKIRTHIEQ